MKTLRPGCGIGYNLPETYKPYREDAVVWSISYLIRISDTPCLLYKNRAVDSCVRHEWNMSGVVCHNEVILEML